MNMCNLKIVPMKTLAKGLRVLQPPTRQTLAKGLRVLQPPTRQTWRNVNTTQSPNKVQNSKIYRTAGMHYVFIGQPACTMCL